MNSSLHICDILRGNFNLDDFQFPVENIELQLDEDLILEVESYNIALNPQKCFLKISNVALNLA